MRQARNLKGQKFGWLTPVKMTSLRENGSVVWKCRCRCKRSRLVSARTLLNGLAKSCGCMNQNKPHGDAGKKKSAEYTAWKNMKARCTNPRHPFYKDYGARGITVCRRWEASYSAFKADMGKRPARHLTLERRNNDRGYYKANCKWATRSEQQRNKRQRTNRGENTG